MNKPRMMLSAMLLTGALLAYPASAAVINLNDPANASRTTWSVPAGTDVTVIGSTAPRDRQISIQGARNVDIRGGVWKPTMREYDGTIHTKNITGSVTISGATIDNSAVRGADGVVVNAGGKTAVPFLMTNSTITGIRGTQGGDHADGVQPQGAVSSFEMKNVRIATDYQGLMLADQPNINYGGKVREIKLTNVGIEKLPGGEGGCRYPIITGGKQTVQLSNVTVYNQPSCRGNGLLNVDNQARISGSVSYDDVESVTGAKGGIDIVSTPPLDAEKITDDIALMRQRGLNDSAIRYSLGLQGIEVPYDVLRGDKTVQEAIADGSMNQSGTPTSWSPPPVSPAPTPDLSPRGSSASGWQPSTTIPSIDAMRRAVQSNTRPPRC